MGKTIKGKNKAKRKAAEAKRKLRRKCKGGQYSAIVAAFALAAFLTGCATTDSAQPAKSQTQNNSFDRCVFVMAAAATVSNGVVVAQADGATPQLEMFTQAQSLESNGTESFAPTATQTPTTDVKPDVNVNYAQGGGISSRNAGASGSSGILETLTGEGLSTLKTWLASGKSGTVTLPTTGGPTVTATCADGSCTFADGTTVTAGDCAACSAQ